MELLAKFEDFSQGEAGWVDKSRIQPGFFTGEQVSTYRDGSVGPRCGVLDLESGSGLPSGQLNNMGYVNITGSFDEWVWVFKGTHLATLPVYDSAGNVLTGKNWIGATGTFALSPTSELCDYVDYEPGRTRIVVSADKVYSADWTTTPPTLSPYTGSPGGRCIEVFGPYLVVANTIANRNRIYFSAPGDHTSWPAGNFFDLGSSNDGVPNIIAMRALREMLVCWTNSGQIFIITTSGGNLEVAGGPIIREFLYADRGTCPGQPDAIARARDGSVWWTRREEIPYQQDQQVDKPSAVPVSFDGTQRIEYPTLGGYLRQLDYSIERRSLTNGWAGRSARNFGLGDRIGRVLLQREGAWSRHHLANIQSRRLTPGLRGEVFGMDPAFTKLMAWVYELDRPPYLFDNLATPFLPVTVDDGGDALDPLPWIATPQVRSPNYGLFSVQRVEVILTAYDTLDEVNSHLECFVQQYDATDAVEAQNVTFVPPDSETDSTAMVADGTTVGCTTVFDAPPPSTPTRLRVAFYVEADQKPALGVRVLLRGLRGVAVHEVVMFGDVVKPARP